MGYVQAAIYVFLACFVSWFLIKKEFKIKVSILLGLSLLGILLYPIIFFVKSIFQYLNCVVSPLNYIFLGALMLEGLFLLGYEIIKKDFLSSLLSNKIGAILMLVVIAMMVHLVACRSLIFYFFFMTAVYYIIYSIFSSKNGSESLKNLSKDFLQLSYVITSLLGMLIMYLCNYVGGCSFDKLSVALVKSVQISNLTAYVVFGIILFQILLAVKVNDKCYSSIKQLGIFKAVMLPLSLIIIPFILLVNSISIGAVMTPSYILMAILVLLGLLLYVLLRSPFENKIANLYSITVLLGVLSFVYSFMSVYLHSNLLFLISFTAGFLFFIVAILGNLLSYILADINVELTNTFSINSKQELKHVIQLGSFISNLNLYGAPLSLGFIAGIFLLGLIVAGVVLNYSMLRMISFCMLLTVLVLIVGNIKCLINEFKCFYNKCFVEKLSVQAFLCNKSLVVLLFLLIFIVIIGVYPYPIVKLSMKPILYMIKTSEMKELSMSILYYIKLLSSCFVTIIFGLIIKRFLYKIPTLFRH